MSGIKATDAEMGGNRIANNVMSGIKATDAEIKFAEKMKQAFHPYGSEFSPVKPASSDKLPEQPMDRAVRQFKNREEEQKVVNDFNQQTKSTLSPKDQKKKAEFDQYQKDYEKYQKDYDQWAKDNPEELKQRLRQQRREFHGKDPAYVTTTGDEIYNPEIAAKVKAQEQQIAQMNANTAAMNAESQRIQKEIERLRTGEPSEAYKNFRAGVPGSPGPGGSVTSPYLASEMERKQKEAAEPERRAAAIKQSEQEEQQRRQKADKVDAVLAKTNPNLYSDNMQNRASWNRSTRTERALNWLASRNIDANNATEEQLNAAAAHANAWESSKEKQKAKYAEARARKQSQSPSNTSSSPSSPPKVLPSKTGASGAVAGPFPGAVSNGGVMEEISNIYYRRLSNLFEETSTNGLDININRAAYAKRGKGPAAVRAARASLANSSSGGAGDSTEEAPDLEPESTERPHIDTLVAPHIETLIRAAAQSQIGLSHGEAFDPRSRDHQRLIIKSKDPAVLKASEAIRQIRKDYGMED